jgi:hypothetical protein
MLTACTKEPSSHPDTGADDGGSRWQLAGASQFSQLDTHAIERPIKLGDVARAAIVCSDRKDAEHIGFSAIGGADFAVHHIITIILANGASYDLKERVVLRRLSREMRVEVGKRQQGRERGRPLSSALRSCLDKSAIASLSDRNENQFGFDSGNQVEVPITMQKRHAAKDRVRGNQTVIRRTWSDARPSTSRIQVRGTARGFSRVGCDDHRQFAKHPVPAAEPIRAVCALQDFLQDGGRKPDGCPLFEGFGQQLNFDQTVTAQVRDPH